MIRNYLKIAWRNIARHKAYAVINIAGLAVGIAACLLLFVIVRFEWSFDRFQSKADRIYRVVTEDKYADGITYTCGIPIPAANALRQDFPNAGITSIMTNPGSQLAVPGAANGKSGQSGKKFIEENGVFFVEPQFFELFDTKWLAGSPSSLADPDMIVLSKSDAIKYFGDWTLAMGQILKMDNILTLKVAGIIEDAPVNSDFNLKVAVSYMTLKNHGDDYGYRDSWHGLSSNQQVFMLLPPGESPQPINASLKKYFSPKYYSLTHNYIRTNWLQPLKDIHFDNRFDSLGDHITSKTTLWTLTLIGVLIIIMASINFVNLSTAQSIGRSKETGIRKVLGSSRWQLIAQAMGETFLITLLSVLLAVILAALALPYLKHIANTPDSIRLFGSGSGIFLLLLTLLVTLSSGMYPAMVLSGFKPVLALKTRINAATVGSIPLRRVLVIGQFAISQVLVIATLVAVRQMSFVRSAELGFDKEAVLVIPGSYTDSLNMEKILPLKQQLLANPAVQSVSMSSDEPSSDNSWISNFNVDHSQKDLGFNTSLKYADVDYVKTFGIHMIAGQVLQASDTSREMMINETLLHKLGMQDPEQAIGKSLRIGTGNWCPIVGVMRDFKTNSLRESVKPLIITENSKLYSRIAIKLKTSRFSEALANIRRLWEKAYPDYVYNAYFLDENIARFYQQENQLELIYKIFACLAIFISCLGLYGLVSFMAVQKTKEVGIRKVLGASVGNIIYLFSREFTWLILIAFGIAIPIAWFTMNNWLNNFAYRIPLQAGVFVIAVLLSLGIAWLTVGYKGLRAALVNPVQSIRSE